MVCSRHFALLIELVDVFNVKGNSTDTGVDLECSARSLADVKLHGVDEFLFVLDDSLFQLGQLRFSELHIKSLARCEEVALHGLQHIVELRWVIWHCGNCLVVRLIIIFFDVVEHAIFRVQFVV